MNTRETIKMQSVNFCYMNYMLQAAGQRSVYMNGKYIQDIMLDDDDTILAVMQDGEVVSAMDVDPEQSTYDIQQWIEQHPAAHECVMALMEESN